MALHNKVLDFILIVRYNIILVIQLIIQDHNKNILKIVCYYNNNHENRKKVSFSNEI